jgi:hypothetical protein
MSKQPAWHLSVDSDRWDRVLASMAGHPLQSTLWGNARHKVDGIAQLLLEYRHDAGEVTGLARIERRPIPVLGEIAWIPKGPVIASGDAGMVEASLFAALRHRGFIVGAIDQYVTAQAPHSGRPKTIWLDLTLGIETLSKNLDSQWRYGAGRALREGVTVRKTRELTEVSSFYRLCNELSVKKRFALPGSEGLMQELIRSSFPDGPVGMSLYLGEVRGVIAGGAFVARCGHHLHYLWGANDRRFSKYRVSEAVHWQIIQDGVASGMSRYDLEGVDPTGNPGVYQFKRKMGGQEVALRGMQAVGLSWAGHVVVGIGRRLGRFA